MGNRKYSLWGKAQERIRTIVGPGPHSRWFEPVELLGIKDGTAVIEVPNRFFKEWIEDNYPGLISSALAEVSGRKCEVRYTQPITNLIYRPEMLRGGNGQ